MACDILLYEPDLVPVGQDQKQHVEITRDLAEKFNTTFSPTFKLPESYIKKEAASIPGTDGQKMSKSYGNTIPVFATDAEVKKAIMGIITDSKSIEDKKDPESCNVFALYQLFASPDELENLRDKYLSGGFGYGDAKKLLLSKFIDYFMEARTKKVALSSKIDYVKEVLKHGNQKANIQANSVMEKVKQHTGLKF
jgi:tryptophanyl-tRNA synthetase